MASKKKALQESTPYYPALTGLRAVGAFLVFFHHYFGNWRGEAFPGSEYLKEGYIGVAIFFTLSGYLLASRYKNSQFQTGRDYFQFWIKRFARVYPLYWILLALCFYLFPILIKGAGQVLANFTLTQGYFGDHLFSALHPAWSLTVEETFYLLLAGIILLLRRLPSVSAIGIALSLISLALWVVGFIFTVFHSPGDIFYYTKNIGTYTLMGRFDEFAFGIFLAYAVNPIQSRLKSKYVDGIFILSIVLIFGHLVLLTWLKGVFQVPVGLHAPFGPLALTTTGLATALLIWSTVKGSFLAQKMLGNRISHYLGKISYSMYLVQSAPIFVSTISPYLKNVWGWQVQYVYIAVPVWIAFSAAAYELIEKPIYRWILSKAQKT